MKSISSLMESHSDPYPRNQDGSKILVPRSPRKKTQRDTDRLADYLVEKFNSPEYRPVFLRAAWRLDAGAIYVLVETALRPEVKNPRAYFIASVKAEPGYR